MNFSVVSRHFTWSGDEVKKIAGDAAVLRSASVIKDKALSCVVRALLQHTKTERRETGKKQRQLGIGAAWYPVHTFRSARVWKALCRPEQAKDVC